MIEEIQEEIRYRCGLASNFFGMGCYDHIESVAHHALDLAKHYGADQEICLLGAWLHDVASITDYDLYRDHHIHGMAIAEDLLSKYDYPKDRLDRVKACIYNHRGSVASQPMSLEEKCVADADAISHFDNLPSLFHLAYVQRGLSLEEGQAFVRAKLDRSFKKMSPSSQAFYRQKKDMVDQVFTSRK